LAKPRRQLGAGEAAASLIQQNSSGAIGNPGFDLLPFIHGVSAFAGINFDELWLWPHSGEIAGDDARFVSIPGETNGYDLKAHGAG
jgi:hypothetical protein